MIKIESVTVLISTTANWDVRKLQELEQQPHMLFVRYITLQHAALTGSQTLLWSAVLTCMVKEQGVRKFLLFRRPLAIMVEKFTHISDYISQINVKEPVFKEKQSEPCTSWVCAALKWNS